MPIVIKKCLRWLPAGVSLLLFMFGEAQGALTVRVAWDPNPENNIAGYRIYHGISGSGQTNVLDIGPSTTGAVTNLGFSTLYWFHVTAYNVFALESDPSTVLFHRTRDSQPLTLTTDEALLTFAPTTVKLSARIEGDSATGNAPNIQWTQVSGPEPMPIYGSATASPWLSATSPGTYTFSLSVSDGTTTISKVVNLWVLLSNPPGTGNTLPILDPPFTLPDGLVLGWSSVPFTAYQVGFKRQLDDTYWILIQRNIESQGDHTYWVDDSGLALQSGFYAIFTIP